MQRNDHGSWIIIETRGDRLSSSISGGSYCETVHRDYPLKDSTVIQILVRDRLAARNLLHAIGAPMIREKQLRQAAYEAILSLGGKVI